MQPRDAHLDHNDDESDCAAAVQVLSVSINHNDGDDDANDQRDQVIVVNSKRGGVGVRSRLASRSDSPTSTMLASTKSAAATTDANQQQQQEVPAIALVGARKRKAVRVVKHAQVSPTILKSLGIRFFTIADAAINYNVNLLSLSYPITISLDF